MDGNTIPVAENTTIIVKASGDLFLEGQEAGEVHFKSSESRIRVHQANDTLYVETHASMDLTVPRRNNVIVEKVGGSGFVQDLSGSLLVQKIGGDLAMQRLGSVRIDKVGGNCLIVGVSDGLTVGKIGGDLSMRTVMGPVLINTIGGDGDLQVGMVETMEARAGGDIRVYISEAVNQKALIRAGGDAEIFLPSNARAQFSLNSGGETVSLNLTRQAETIQESIDVHNYEFKLGEGGAQFEVMAGGDIRISDEMIEPEAIVSELERREEAWKESRDRRGSPSWSGGFGFDRSSAWAEMVSRRAQEAARRAEQRTQAAMRRTEEQISQAAEREMRRSWAGMPPIPQPPSPQRPPVERVTEQERLMVLQMLQENKITVEQAEKLLEALEGRYNR
jgi:hypothetical protein